MTTDPRATGTNCAPTPGTADRSTGSRLDATTSPERAKAEALSELPEGRHAIRLKGGAIVGYATVEEARAHAARKRRFRAEMAAAVSEAAPSARTPRARISDAMCRLRSWTAATLRAAAQVLDGGHDRS